MPQLSTHEAKPDFLSQLAAYRAAHHGARPYDIAQALGVSELEVILASTDRMSVTGLDVKFEELFARLPEFGRAMALTRNDSTVSEVKGIYGAPKFHGPMGLVHHDEIDLRMFTYTWAFAVAIEQAKGEDVLRSIQIFDRYGKAVHKVYPQEFTAEAWKAFVDSLAKRTITREEVLPKVETAPVHSLPEVDVGALRSDWLALQDTHDFHGMLRKHKADRLLAFEIVGQDLAREVPVDSLVELIQTLRKEQLRFMVFVGNNAMIQIRSGVAKETRMLGSWFNILDPDFNLHVNMQKLKSAWLVRKPSRYGDVISLEVFDHKGELALSLFGYRSEDLDVDPQWAALVAKVLPIPATV